MNVDHLLPGKNGNFAKKNYDLGADLTVCYYHVTYKFQSESTLYSLPECLGTPYSKQAPYLKFK